MRLSPLILLGLLLTSRLLLAAEFRSHPAVAQMDVGEVQKCDCHVRVVVFYHPQVACGREARGKVRFKPPAGSL